MVSFLDKNGTLLVYKTQVKSYLEYGALTWKYSTVIYLKRLDKVEWHVQ